MGSVGLGQVIRTKADCSQCEGDFQTVLSKNNGPTIPFQPT